ncbi:unnamed protein product [Alopecurus aequalis]
MAGAGEDEAAPPPLNRQRMDEPAAAARKQSRLEHHRSVGDEPSFRMENLPEEIQPVVMSLLPLKEAVRTSIVSRSWRMLWRFHTNLCFYVPNVLDYDSDEYDVNDRESIDNFIKTKRDKFIEEVNWVIQRHSGIGINKFSIRCGLRDEDFDHLDRWIAFAASSKAKVIEFDLKIFNDWPYEEVHHFPLEALDVQGSSFVHFLSLADVSIKPHSEKATMMLEGRKGLGRVFTLIPSILPVNILNVRAYIREYEQLQKLTTRSHRMFTHLRHMTCEVAVRSMEPKADNGLLQLAHCLNIAPQLETLHLDMVYNNGKAWSIEVEEEEEDSPMRGHDHLRTVYISGFRLYGAQTKLACCILENAPFLEHMQLEPRCADGISGRAYVLNMDVEKDFIPQVCEWASLASLRFGKVVTAPSE